MPSYGVQTEINAPAADVFAYISDLTRHGQWSADPLEIRLVEGDGGVGSRYRSIAKSKGKTITAEIAVTESDSPTMFAFEVSDLTGRYTHKFALQAYGQVTRLERRITTSRLSPAQRVLFYIVYPTVKRPNAQRALAKLKTRLEAGLESS